MSRELRLNRDRADRLRRARESKWRALREVKKRLIVATSATFALAVVAAYQSEQASFFSSGRAWALVGLGLFVLSFVFGAFASNATERMRMDANRDGLFLLQALGRYGTDSNDSKVGREVHDLLWSVALYLKDGQAVPDGIRNEAIRVAEQALGRDADATDQAP